MTPDQYRALAADNDRLEKVALPARLAEQHSAAVSAALRAAADQLEAVQALLNAAHDKFAAVYDAERMTGRGPSAIGIAGAPLASSVQHALGLLRAKASANIERLTADTTPQEEHDD